MTQPPVEKPKITPGVARDLVRKMMNANLGILTAQECAARVAEEYDIVAPPVAVYPATAAMAELGHRHVTNQIHPNKRGR